MTKEEEWARLAQLEQSSTATRLTTFCALLSISFLVPSFAVKADDKQIPIFSTEVSLVGLAFFLGFVFYVFAVFHYSWYHRHAHIYRARLKKLEAEIGIEIYRLRRRPVFGRMKLHYDWFLHIIGVIYGFVAYEVSDGILFLYGFGLVLVLYGLLAVRSRFYKEEPLE